MLILGGLTKERRYATDFVEIKGHNLEITLRLIVTTKNSQEYSESWIQLALSLLDHGLLNYYFRLVSV